MNEAKQMKGKGTHAFISFASPHHRKSISELKQSVLHSLTFTALPLFYSLILFHQASRRAVTGRMNGRRVVTVGWVVPEGMEGFLVCLKLI